MNDSLKSLSRSDDSASPQKRRRLPSWVIPLGIMLGFGLLFLLLFRDRLLPAADVKVAIVLSTRSLTDSAEPETNPDAASPTKPRELWRGPMAFQASGWIEPDPLPIKATALASGVIDQVHVLEGEAVSKGQLLASLIREDYELELREAQSALKVRVATFEAHHQEVAAVKIAVVAAKAGMEAAKAKVTETTDRMERIENLPKGALSAIDLIAIQTDHQNALAALRSAEAKVKESEAKVLQHLGRTEVLANEVEVAKVKLAKAELALSRTLIKSPINGRVLRLNSAPGQKKMLAMDDPDSATIAILYDPEHLQARVDVPLADAAGLMVGQLARVKCNLLPDQIFLGEVTRITGEADIARNTLQAKVRIIDPNDQLRPEMLCRVEFLELRHKPGSKSSTGSAHHRDLVTWIPEQALTDGGETAWVCEPESKRVTRRKIVVTETRRDGHVLVREGMKPGEWVVLSPKNLSENQRVNPELIESP